MKIRLPFTRSSTQYGFTHVELLLAVVFVAIFAMVGVRVISASHAATVPYLTSTTTCTTLRGRNFVGGTGNPCGSTCPAGHTLVVAPVYNYCSGYETASNVISSSLCASLGRVWLSDGCARLASQVTTKGPVAQCINSKATYTVTSTNDKCVVPVAAAPSPTPTPTPTPAPKPTPSPTPTPGPTNTAVTDPLLCKLLGRSGSGSVCNIQCVAGAGSLVTTGKYAYCSGALTPSATIGETSCVATLHRKWLVDGCARLWAQSPASVPNAIQCNIAGQTYYVISTYDSCNTSSASATTAAAAATKAAKSSQPPSGKGTSSGSSATGSGSGSTAGLPNLSRTDCKLLGRNMTGSTCDHTCLPGYGTLITTKTYDYCSGAVSSKSLIGNEKFCNALDRKWLSSVDGCAHLPAIPNVKSVANAIQCLHSGETYSFSSSLGVCSKPPQSFVSKVVSAPVVAAKYIANKLSHIGF